MLCLFRVLALMFTKFSCSQSSQSSLKLVGTRMTTVSHVHVRLSRGRRALCLPCALPWPTSLAVPWHAQVLDRVSLIALFSCQAELLRGSASLCNVLALHTFFITLPCGTLHP